MPVRLIHFTDLHLLTSANTLYDGFDSDASLRQTLACLRAQAEPFDSLIVTGDLAHDEQRETYLRIRDLFLPWLPKCVFIPGNHDCRDSLYEVLPYNLQRHGERLNSVITVGNWRLIGLDSHVPGEIPGRLGPDQIHWLQRELNSAPDRPTLLFIHHPPVTVGSPWLDEIGLTDAEEFWRIVRGPRPVYAICCGHVHQEMQSERNGVVVLTTPSTSIQFVPRTLKPEYENTPPGFRILELSADGFNTRVVRLASGGDGSPS